MADRPTLTASIAQHVAETVGRAEMRADLALDDQVVEVIAAVTHAANREWCRVQGDLSQADWLDAPSWQRDSMRAGVRGLLDGSLATPEAQHEAWAAHKRAEGWTYGPVKDPVAKTHPCLVPHAALPLLQKVKDHLSRGVVLAIADGLCDEALADVRRGD